MLIPHSAKQQHIDGSRGWCGSGGSLTRRVLYSHTDGHVCYRCRETDGSAAAPVVFTGDSLFVAGSGRSALQSFSGC